MTSGVYDIDALLRDHDPSKLEFMRSVKTADDLARVIAAFANADGGLIVVGVSEKSEGPRQVVGCDVAATKTMCEAAKQVLRPVPVMNMRDMRHSNGPVVLLSVGKSSEPIAFHGAVYRRYTGEIKSITPEDLHTLITVPAIQGKDEYKTGVTNVSLNHLARMLSDASKQIERMERNAHEQENRSAKILSDASQQIERLEQSLKEQSSLRARLPEWIFSGIVGLVLGGFSGLIGPAIDALRKGLHL